MEESNCPSIILEGIIMSKKILGKNLGFISLKVDSIVYEIELKETKTAKKMKVWDLIRVEGFDSPENTNLIARSICLLKRMERIPVEKTNLNYKHQQRGLCKFFKLNLDCTKENCEYRHFFKEGEKEKMETLEKRRQEMINLNPHDFLPTEEKGVKSKRHKLFSEFLVETYGLENLQKSHVIDVASGSGLVSFYLSLNYGIKCYLFDPKLSLPKFATKKIKKNNLPIHLFKKEFTEETIDLSIVENCSLILGK